MSLVDVKGVNFVPGIIIREETGPLSRSRTLDADGELVGCVIQIPRTGSISKIGFRTRTVTQSDAIKVSLQTVDPTNGRPTGTLIHADAFGVQATIATDTNYWVSLQNDVSVTRNNARVAIVVEFNSFVNGNFIINHGIRSFPSSGLWLPYVFDFVSSVWTLEDDIPNFALEYNDDVIEPILHTFPAVTPVSASWDDNDTPNRRGLRFSLPYNCRVSGIFLNIALNGDADIEIYDSDGVTIISDGTIPLDKDIKSGIGTSGMMFVQLATPFEVTKDAFYRAVIHPTTGTNITIYTLVVTDDGANEAMNAIDGGVNFHYTETNGSPSAEGDWTQTLTKRPLIGLIINQLDDGTAVCDFPAVGDVEKGVQFDNNAKTGTFKEPGIANVKSGVQYGAGDTEFTGTYAQNIVTGAVITGQDTVGTIVGG